MDVCFHHVLFDRWPPGAAVFDRAVGLELREPELVLGWSTVDYARSTNIIPNTGICPRIPAG
jgi:hypothetical protein